MVVQVSRTDSALGSTDRGAIPATTGGVVHRLKASTDSDFAEWMTARQGRLLRTAYLLTGDPHTAQDLVQNALAKIYLRWDRISDREHIDAYARAALVNEHRSLWRRPWRRREVVSAQLPEQAGGEASYDGMSAALWAYVQTLPPRQRAVVVLRYYEELTEAEAADVLGISVGTVKSQTSRALATLRSGLADHPELSGKEDG
jgi:RNA polymerase sigma-70 factor (sigma-E family)